MHLPLSRRAILTGAAGGGGLVRRLVSVAATLRRAADPGFGANTVSAAG